MLSVWTISARQNPWQDHRLVGGERWTRMCRVAVVERFDQKWTAAAEGRLAVTIGCFFVLEINFHAIP